MEMCSSHRFSIITTEILCLIRQSPRWSFMAVCSASTEWTNHSWQG